MGAKQAEREGFEPPVPFSITGFQDQRHQPLGHLSVQPLTAPETLEYSIIPDKVLSTPEFLKQTTAESAVFFVDFPGHGGEKIKKSPENVAQAGTFFV